MTSFHKDTTAFHTDTISNKYLEKLINWLKNIYIYSNNNNNNIAAIKEAFQIGCNFFSYNILRFSSLSLQNERCRLAQIIQLNWLVGLLAEIPSPILRIKIQDLYQSIYLQEMSSSGDYFNWSMTYRSDSDVLFPYGWISPIGKHDTQR